METAAGGSAADGGTTATYGCAASGWTMVANDGSAATLEAINTAGHVTLRAELEAILAARGAGCDLEELLRLAAADHASVRARLRELGIDKLGEKLRIQAALRRLSNVEEA